MEERYLLLSDMKNKLEEVKLELAQEIYRELICLRISQKRMAKKLGTSQANISRVVNRRTNELTLGQLFRFLVILNPKFRMMISPR